MNTSRRRWLQHAISIAALSSLAPLLSSADAPKTGVAFTVETDKNWPTVEKAGAQHPVRVDLTITNSTPADVNIGLFDTLTPVVTFPDGKSQRLEVWRKDSRTPPPLAVLAGGSNTIKFDAHVYWIKRGDGMSAEIVDPTLGTWRFGNLPVGKYTLSFHYKNTEKTNKEGTTMWVGKADSDAAKFEVAR